eukprot:gene22625-16733_t
MFSTPVAIFHVDGTAQAELNKGLAGIAMQAEAGVFGPHGGFGGHPQRWVEHGVFQTGRERLHGKHGCNDRANNDPTLAAVRAFIYRGIQQYVSSAPPDRGAGCRNVFTARPATCNVGVEERNKVGHMTLDITSAWINKLHAVHPRFRSESIYQGPHEHMGWGTGISGVYYAAMGWSARNGSGAEDGRFVPPTFKKKSTKFNVMKPIRFAGLDSGSNVSPFESIDPTPGTLLLFPSWLRHSAELHVGDEHRIVVAFNVEIDLGLGGREQKDHEERLRMLPILIPKDQCSANLCE